MFSLKKHLFISSSHFLIWLLVILLLSCMSSLCSLYVSSSIDVWFANIFSPFGRLAFYFVLGFLWYIDNFLVWCSPTCLFLILLTLISVPNQKPITKTNVKDLPPMLSSRSFKVSDLIIVFNPFWVYFCVCCMVAVQFYSFACCCLVFPLIEETINSWLDYYNVLLPDTWFSFLFLNICCWEMENGGLVTKSGSTLLWPHELWPARLLCPWDLPGKNTGSGLPFPSPGEMKNEKKGISISGKEPTHQYRRHKRCGFDPWVWKIPWMKAWQPTPIFLLRESHGQRNRAGCSPQGLTHLATWSVWYSWKNCSRGIDWSMQKISGCLIVEDFF